MSLSRLQKLEQKAQSLSTRHEGFETPVVPDIVEFVESDRYLNRSGLYPRQWTILKVMFLQDHVFTDYDLRVLERWASDFERGLTRGVQPDVFDRITRCKSQGRNYFREVVALIGRRGGKNYLGAIAAAYVTWQFLCKGNPQRFYGLDEGQRLSFLVFAGNYLQARSIQFDTIERVVSQAPCFAPFLAGRAKSGQLLVLTPSDLEAIGERDASEHERIHRASMEIAAKQTTMLAGRGPTAYGHAWDEMAHATATSSSVVVDEVFQAALPSLDQFGTDAFIYESSTPWQKIGQLYENYQRALEVAPDGAALHPESLMFQLSSFEPYVDFERAHTIPMRPGGPCCARKRSAIQTFDEHMAKEKQTNPERFEVERLSQFASVQEAYLPRDQVAAMFEPWDGQRLLMQRQGVLGFTYRAHADPGRVGSNFGLVVAHGETRDSEVHVVLDLVRQWRPAEFPDRCIDFVQVEAELVDLIEAFHPAEFTFDQWNSASFIDRLRHYVRTHDLPNDVAVYEIPATAARNLDVAETFKAALAQGRIHAPYLDPRGNVFPAAKALEEELLFLQDRGGKVDHPTTGPVTTKDVADAAMACVHSIISEGGPGSAAHQLSSLSPSGSLPSAWSGRPATDPDLATSFSAAGRRRRRYDTSPARGGRLRAWRVR